MDVGNIPPALVRSGRIELWLEMRLPDLSARMGILKPMLQRLQHELGEIDTAAVAEATDTFTGADLKRLVEDGKTAYAYDLLRDEVKQPMIDYFLRAAEAIRRNRQVYQEAEQRTRQERPTRPTWFSPTSNFHVSTVIDGSME
jgi:transitional endoplasmic reticulum ATPase